MDMDFYDNIPKFDLPHITVPDFGISQSAMASIAATQNRIASAVDTSALTGAISACSTLATVTAGNSLVNSATAAMPGCIAALESLCAATSSISESFHNEATDSIMNTAATIANSFNHSAMDSVLASTSMIADSLHNDAMDAVLETSTRIADSVNTSIAASMGSALSRMVDLFAGVGSLMTNAMTEAINSMAARMAELRSRMSSLIAGIIERLRDFFTYRRYPHWLTPAMIHSMRVLQYIRPPITIRFRDFVSIIRKVYLMHARERDSSDDDNDGNFNLLLVNFI